MAGEDRRAGASAAVSSLITSCLSTSNPTAFRSPNMFGNVLWGDARLNTETNMEDSTRQARYALRMSRCARCARCCGAASDLRMTRHDKCPKQSACTQAAANGVFVQMRKGQTNRLVKALLRIIATAVLTVDKTGKEVLSSVPMRNRATLLANIVLEFNLACTQGSDK